MTLAAHWQSALAVALGTVVAACSNEIPDFARRGQSPAGPSVRYDLFAGTQAVPWPNDTLCWLDDEQPGPCLPNLPTATLSPYLASWVVAINATRGWSPNGPIVLPITRATDAQSGFAIDLARLLALQQDHDWSNDAIYLVDLETGLPHTLDFPTTRGSFILQQTIELDPSDVRRAEPSLTAETIYEGLDSSTTAVASATDSVDGSMYHQRWDSDSDGVIDVPSILPGRRCSAPIAATEGNNTLALLRDRCLADEVVDVYDPATNTLRLYPRAPLAQGRQYAVVLTDRLVDSEERPIQSPFADVSHPRQHRLAERVLDWLKTPDLGRYYGSVTDNPSQHVRFVWGFTTATPSADLARRFRRLQPDVHAQTTAPTSTTTRLTLERQHDLDATCSSGSLRRTIAELLREQLGLTATEEQATLQSLGSIASVVIGTFSHPTYGDDTIAERVPPIASRTDIPFWLTVPRMTSPDSALPFVLVSHEQDSGQIEGLRWAGYWASLGLATVGFARTGTPTDALDLAISRVQQHSGDECSTAFLLDLGRPRSDADAWYDRYLSDVDPDVVATRDRWRRDAVEMATLAKSLESSSEVIGSFAPARQLSPAGAFGVGTGAATAALAASLLHGTLSVIMVDPATSPDRAWRRGATWGAPPSNLWHVFGPRLAGVPVDAKDSATRCGPKEASIRLVSADATQRGTEVGCLPLGGILSEDGATAIATNLTTMGRRCVAVSKSGQFSLGLPAAANDAFELSIYDSLDVVVRLGRDADCALVSESLEPLLVLGGGTLNASDSSIVAPTHGVGLERQSSELLHALDLAGAAFSPANPAPFVSELAQPNHPTDARGLLLSVTPGDSVVTPDEGLMLARAARLVPTFLPKTLETYWELAADVTPSIASALTKPTAAARVEEARLQEGAPRLERFPVNLSICGSNESSDSGLAAVCTEPKLTEERCAQYLPDLDALAGTAAGFGARQPVPSLRLARYAGRPEFDNLTELWSPQSRVIGLAVQPTHPDWPFVALALPLADPLGAHGMARDDLCRGFRFGTYMAYLVGQFIASGGTDYPPVTRRDTQQCLATPESCSFLTLTK